MGGTFLYEYDALNQLTKETRPNGDVYVYSYDAGGNITTRTKNGTPLHTYGYASTGWKDLLTSFDGTSITYDAIGNPNNWRDGMTFTWQAGRQLATLQKGTTGVSYTYGSDGTRLTKTVNGVKTSYTWDGAQLVSQTTTGGDTLYFTYHGNSRVAVEYKGNTYYYIYNLQGDVVGLVNSSGTSVVSYTYDAWGNPESITGSMASTLGVDNPFRYRSYYFDTESGLYYLMSRYYDPVVGRFLNADGAIGANLDMTSDNLFIYCGNNPINRFDISGGSWLSDAWNDVKNKASEVWDWAATKATEIYDYVTNTNEQVVLDAKFIAFYKGKMAVKLPIGSNAASFGVMFIGNDVKNRSDAIDTIKHEYGHTKQFDKMGLVNYTMQVAIPSVTCNLLDRQGLLPYDYYSSPWEYQADMYGGVNRGNYTSWAASASTTYTILGAIVGTLIGLGGVK